MRNGTIERGILSAAILLAATCSVEGAVAATHRDASMQTSREPVIAGRLPAPVARRLKAGYAAASERVHQPPCQSLFEPFAKQGWVALRVSRYRMASAVQERRVCRPGVAAFTAVGSPTTRLCRSFARLSAQGAARVLVHEALHYAGMPESPSDPDALDSAAINQLVAEYCGL